MRTVRAVPTYRGVIAVHAVQYPGHGREDVAIVVTNRRAHPLTIAPKDFSLVAQGDVFGARAWTKSQPQIVIPARASRRLRLSFGVPARLVGASLAYRTAQGAIQTVPLRGSATTGAPAAGASAAAASILTFWVTQGVGEPWGTAFDAAGNLWFADPGCDFAPTCGSGTPPGEIGEIKAASHALAFYRLPAITGNQPIFLAFDSSGDLWFTTPNNSKIGEFNPGTGHFVGQWSVTPGSGPWDLAISGNALWYTEHLGSALGRFDVIAHTHRDYQTPSANSNPYGLAIAGSTVWFTENNSTVDQVGALNTSTGVISEYRIVLPVSGTPHMITIGPGGRPWWSEGWSNTIATLNPSAATPGSCGVSSGTCAGIQRYALPVTTACSGSSHVSGIDYSASSSLIRLDNSLTAQVGSFNPVSGAFAMTTLSNCSAHPHDGTSLDTHGHLWFDEEFGNAIGELIG